MMYEKFFTDSFKTDDADVIVFGIPLGDKSLQALQSIRKESWRVEPYDMERDVNLVGDLKIADIGNYRSTTPEDILRSTKKILEWGKFPLILGGQHTLTLFASGAFPADVKIIDFDAHTDIKDQDCFTSQKFSHMTWVRRFCETRGPENIAIVGARSCDEDDMSYIRSNNILCFTTREVKDKYKSVKERLENFAAGSPVYITLDIDVFDPSIAPAVDYPEPGGIFFTQFSGLMENIRNIVGMDLVEVKPMQDNRVTEFLAVKCIFEVLSKLKK
jgi:agmatinase